MEREDRVATPEQQMQSMLRNLEDKTGNTLEHWLGVVKDSGLDKHGAIVKMLKADHRITHGYANLVAHESLKSAAAYADDPGLVAAQYAGKNPLRPIYERIVAAVEAFGDDIELAPKKAYVSLRRAKQFGIVQPSTKTRVDVGINLKGVDPGGRLEASGSFNAMVSHRVRVSDAAEVDDELIGWLRDAYEAAG
jgi:hypothetical protein